TEGQHHRGRVKPQGEVDRPGVNGPALEADSPRLAGALHDDRQLVREPVAITVAAAEESEAAAIGYRCGERTASDPAHRRQRDRVLDAEKPGERRGHGHSRIATFTKSD